MTPWIWALLGLAAPVAAAVVMASRGPIARRLVALQFATPLTVVALAVGSFAFDQSSSIDLALTLALVGAPASLLFAIFLERWL